MVFVFNFSKFVSKKGDKLIKTYYLKPRYLKSMSFNCYKNQLIFFAELSMGRQYAMDWIWKINQKGTENKQ